MKHLKMLGLVVALAAGLTAFLGAGSAAATVLCQTAVSPCPEEEKWVANTLLDASLSGSVMWDTGNECTESTITAKTTGNGSATQPVPLNVEALTFASCTANTTVVTPGELQIDWISGTADGRITDRGTAGTVSMVLGFCNWSFGTEWVSIGRVYGGNPAAIEINAPLSGNCPFSRLTGGYTVTAPEPLYVEAS